MNDIELRIRELPLPAPSEALDGRMAELFRETRVVRRPDRARWAVLIGTALAAGIAGFAAGVGTGQWLVVPPELPSFAESSPDRTDRQRYTQASYVRLIDSRVGTGLDFSQSLEPFHVHLTSQEGSESDAH